MHVRMQVQAGLFEARAAACAGQARQTRAAGQVAMQETARKGRVTTSSGLKFSLPHPASALAQSAQVRLPGSSSSLFRAARYRRFSSMLHRDRGRDTCRHRVSI